MSLDKILTDKGILPLLITYQTEGERVDYARQESARVGLTPKTVLSIRSDDPRGAELYDPRMNARWRKNPMTSGEIACYWGHRQAWQVLLQEKAAYALILEDDFHVKDPELLKRAVNALPDMPIFDILLLRTHNPRGAVRSQVLDGFAVEKRLYGTTGATGYLITAEGAKKLLTRQQIFRPVDEDFIAPWELGLQIMNLNPTPIGETEMLTSSLDSQRAIRPTKHKRPLYKIWLKMRWQILSFYHWLDRR